MLFVDLCTLFDRFARGQIPFPVFDNAWFNHEWQEDIQIKKTTPGWPHAFRQWNSERVIPVDRLEWWEFCVHHDPLEFRNPVAAKLLGTECFNRSVQLLRSGGIFANEWLRVARFWLIALDVLGVGDKEEDECKAILLWANDNRTQIKSILMDMNPFFLTRRTAADKNRP